MAGQTPDEIDGRYGETLHVRCDDDFKRRVKMAAAADGYRLSEYVRTVLAEDVDEKGIELPTTD